MATRSSLRLLTGLAVLAASLGVTPSPVLAADGMVGDASGNPALCTEAAFNAALSTVQSSGSGTITFNCGAAMHTIIFTGEKVIQSTVTIDGGGRITLSGGNTTRLFTVAGPSGILLGGRLTLRGLTLRNGAASEGGAILHLGRSLQISNSQLIANTATTGSGGAIASYGPATLTDTQIMSNTTPATTGSGGGLYNASTLTMSGGLVSGNQAMDFGGGIYNTGTLSVTNASLTNNAANRAGGALFDNSAIARISNSLVQANSSELGGGIGHSGGTLILTQVLVANNGNANNAAGAYRGGGVYLFGTGVYTLTAVTFWRNRADAGGGLAQINGSLTLLNSTLSENRALSAGGGLYFDGGSASVRQVTITDNRVDADPSMGGGAGVWVATFGLSLALTNTVLTSNRLMGTQADANCGGVALTASFSLSSDGTCAFGLGRDNVALPLGLLQNNGGFTPTHLLPQGSPAIDAGTNTLCPATDQRGQARPIGAACDVGAIEARPTDFVTRLYLPSLQK